MLTEGTNISAEKGLYADEDAIYQKALTLMQEYKGDIFVLCSATNYARIEALSRAASECGLTVCEDLFQHCIQQSQGTVIFVSYPIDKTSR